MSWRSWNKPLRSGIFLLAFACACSCIISGCGNNPIDGESYSSVYIVGTELLEPPAVPRSKLYKPAYNFAVREANDEAIEIVGFYLTVSVSDSQELQLRLVDRSTQLVTNLACVVFTTASDLSARKRLKADASTVANLLQAQTPVFRVQQDSFLPGTLEHQVEVLIPRAILSADMRLEVFTSTAADGSPVGKDWIELVEDYFYMAAIGDSTMWCNGVREEDKFHTLVADEIERRTGRKVIKQLLAVSGAPVAPQSEEEDVCGPNCFGEAPAVIPSVTTQAENIRRPELMDLILVTGCINDVRIGRIIDVEISQEEIEEVTRQACHDRMEELILRLKQLAPQAQVIITGYYQIVSLDSDLFGLREFAVVNNTEPTDDEEMAAFVQTTSANSRRFYDVSTSSLTEVVATANEGEDRQRIWFVDPGFGPENAMFMPDSWLWSLTAENEFIGELLETGLRLFPEDPMVDLRAEVCLEGDIMTALPVCLYASVGHPNVQGSQAYAQAILDTFDQAELWNEFLADTP